MILKLDFFAVLLVGTAHLFATKANASDIETLKLQADSSLTSSRISSSSSSFLRSLQEINGGAMRDLQSIGLGSGAVGAEESSEVNFRATYAARFQHLVDSSCEAPNPTVSVFCQGDISPVTISDATIECSSTTDQDGWKGLLCTNTCGSSSAGTSCDEVFQVSEEAGGEVYGTVIFQCEGADIVDVDTYMVVAGGDEGSCVAQAATAGDTLSRNFRVAELGVQCDESSFFFDDAYFECDLPASSANIDSFYSCLEGSNCAGEACTITFEDLRVEADHENFYDCVESVGGASIPPKPSKIESEPVPTGDYTATFQANWQLLLDMDTCRGEFAPKRISCTNGDITLEETLAADITCTTISSSEMECVDGGDSFVNEFSGVRFSCQSEDEVPQAMVEYMSGDAFCEGTDNNAVVHMVQLGVECSDSDGDFSSYSDYLLECGADSVHNVMSGRFTCGAAAFFSSSIREDTPTGVAKIATDFRWGSGLFDICYTRTAGPTQPSGTVGEAEPTPTTAPAAAPKPTPASTPTTPTLVDEPPTQSETEVEAVPGTTYSAEYLARFKRVIDDGCEGPSKDTAYIVCPYGKLEILETSDFVVCIPVVDTTSGDGEYTLCETTCRGVACDSDYVERDSFWVLSTWVLDEDIYAEVSYTCSAEDDVNGVDSLFTVLGSEITNEEGSCTGEGNGEGKNAVLGQLHVMCDTPEGRVAVNNHAYTECDYGNLWVINGDYTCWAGRFCQDTACAVAFDDMDIIADHHNFQECIMTDNGSDAPKPEVSVEGDDTSPGQYSAQFRVGSGYFYDEDDCSGSLTGLKIECIDGTISLIEGSADKSCSVISESTIECIEETGIINEFVDVATYECTSQDGVPQTKVEYYSAELECDSTAVERGRRWVDLGVLCSSSTGGVDIINRDFFVECGKENVVGEVSVDPVTSDDIRFACKGEVEVPENSAGSAFTIPKAETFTDYRWEFYSLDTCYNFKPTAKSLAKHDAAKALVDEAKESFGGRQRLLLQSSVNAMSSSATSKNVLMSFAVALFAAGSFLF